jgi:uncharacterized membrane protein
METFLIVVFTIIILIYLASKFSDLSKQNSTLINKATKMEHEIAAIKKLIASKPFTAGSSHASTVYTQAPVVPEPIIEKPTPPIATEEPQEKAPTQPEDWQAIKNRIEKDLSQREEYATKVPEMAQPMTTPERTERKPAFAFLENLDWEKFIGENLINKIGIGILVLGIGFFVKYAIDKDWINEIGRVFIGIICGGALVGTAHKLRKEYNAFSSVLIGGGLSVFYFSIAIAFHEYQLIGQTAAFLIMILITAFAILLSIAYNRQELAVLAIIGGFTTPFLVSTGEGNYVVLFSYLLILNTGMLVLAYFRKWNIVNIVSYAFTVILYTGWFTTKVMGKPDAPYAGALFFATLFYLEFFAMNIINNIKNKAPFRALDFSILLSNTFMYFAAGMLALAQIEGGVYKGLFTVVLAAFNFLFAFSLLKSSKADKNLVYVLIGLVLTFISLAAPVQLDGNWITMFWALEAVLLLWLAQRSGIFLIKLSSVLVTGLMLISLVMDWAQLYSIHVLSKGLPVLLNKAFITSLVSLGSLYLTRRLLKNEKEALFLNFIPVSTYRTIIFALLIIGSYVTLLLELNYQLHAFVSVAAVRHIYLGIYHFTWLAAITHLSRNYKVVISEVVLPGICALSTVLYVSYYHMLFKSARALYFTDEATSLLPFLSHYLIVLLYVVILSVTIQSIGKNVGFKSIYGKLSYWFLAIMVLFIASSELDHLVVLSFYSEAYGFSQALDDSRRIGYPIIWGICSFAFILYGIKKKVRQLRIISLSIFFTILLKLFLVDVVKMPEGGKIVAFIILGLMLLTISFLYQKLKKLIIDDEAPAEDPLQTPLT